MGQRLRDEILVSPGSRSLSVSGDRPSPSRSSIAMSLRPTVACPTVLRPCASGWSSLQIHAMDIPFSFPVVGGSPATGSRLAGRMPFL